MTNPVKKTLNLIEQWASRVIDVSSQYNATTWAADKCLGPPRVYPNYGDIPNTWAQSNDSLGANFIELGYPQESYVNQMKIYETYHAGAVIRIFLKNKKSNSWVMVWEATGGAVDIQSSRIFSPDLKRTNFKTDEIRLELDCSIAQSYCEIDAVQLIGKKFLVDSVITEQSLRDNLAKLLLSEELSDVKFKINDSLISAHRNILTFRSELFKDMLIQLHDPAKPILIENISFEAFQGLLYFIYTNTVSENLTVETICELARSSDLYKIEELKERCYELAKTKLCIENVLPLFLCAVSLEPKLDVVEAFCLRFIAKNFTQLLERPEFRKLPPKYLIQITQYYAQFQK